MNQHIHLTGLYIYPVKSLAGIALDNSEVDTMGLKHDRRWMVVSKDGNFLSQRTHPQMALIQPELSEAGQLSLSSSDKHILRVPKADAASTMMKVKVWDDEVSAVLVSTKADQWLEEVLGDPCHLVYIPDSAMRQCDMEYAREGDRTGFSDGFPFLLISEASLADLNNRLERKLPMKRFRPNLVVSGCEAYAEDDWKEITIGSVNMRVVKPCSRCVITTVNPETGRKQGAEPLKTLATYRRKDNKVYFGQNVIQNEVGQLSCADKVQILA